MVNVIFSRTQLESLAGTESKIFMVTCLIILISQPFDRFFSNVIKLSQHLIETQLKNEKNGNLLFLQSNMFSTRFSATFFFFLLSLVRRNITR